MTISMVIERSVRCIGRRHLDLWAAPRRSHFLVKTDVENIVSVDTAATPPADPTDPPDETIELIVVADIGVPKAYPGWADFVQGNAIPEPYDARWEALGFDICDASLLSGLVNCGIDQEDRQEVEIKWAHLVNRFHLFDEPGVAESYRRHIHLLVPEHAPFFVVRLYGLRCPKLPAWPPCMTSRDDQKRDVFRT